MNPRISTIDAYLRKTDPGMFPRSGLHGVWIEWGMGRGVITAAYMKNS